MPSLGWGAVVAGNPRDVTDWAHVLKQPFDPWVEPHNSQFILRSSSMDEFQEASRVRDVAIALIERLNGAPSMLRR
jgi:hypothetical protein